MTAWLAETPADQRDTVVGGVVLLGLATLPFMVINVVVIVVLLVRLRLRRRVGLLQRAALAGLGGMHVAFWLVRWKLFTRLRRVLAEAGVEPGP